MAFTSEEIAEFYLEEIDSTDIPGIKIVIDAGSNGFLIGGGDTRKVRYNCQYIHCDYIGVLPPRRKKFCSKECKVAQMNIIIAQRRRVPEGQKIKKGAPRTAKDIQV